MKLYIDYEAYGENGEPLKPVEITPEYIDALIEKVRYAVTELLDINYEGSVTKMSTRDIPNEETIAAINEAEVLLDDPNAMRFSSVDDLFEELRS